MLNRRYNKKIKKSKLILMIFLLTMIGVITYYFVSMRPVILNSIVHNGKVYANQILLSEVADVIFNNEINYGNIIYIQRDENGDVISTKVDSETINKIKIDISQKIMDKFAQKRSYRYEIQLGTLLGNEFSIGRGYDITMEIFPIGVVQTEIVSSFENAGINQTKHILSLVVTLEYNTIVPLNKSDGVVTSEFLLAETTIIGKVPQFYADLTV